LPAVSLTLAAAPAGLPWVWQRAPVAHALTAAWPTPLAVVWEQTLAPAVALVIASVADAVAAYPERELGVNKLLLQCWRRMLWQLRRH
jgi:hypothetical protein